MMDVFRQVVVAGCPERTSNKQFAWSASTQSPPHTINHSSGMSSSDRDDVTDHPGRLCDDVTRHVVEVQLDKGVVGLGFCIEGGKQSLTGDRPIAVKRIFRGM